jgi:hypothetical protein
MTYVILNGDTSQVISFPAPERDKKITNLAFTKRFTDAEAIQLDLVSIGATVQAAAIRRYMKKVDLATYIDLDDADTRAGVQALEGMGLLLAGRAAEILDATITEHERVKP